MKIDIVGSYHLTIEVPDDQPDIFARAADPSDFPYWNRDGSGLTKSQLIDHLAHNAVSNGVQSLDVLDGFGDLVGTTVRVDEVEVDRWLAGTEPSRAGDPS